MPARGNIVYGIASVSTVGGKPYVDSQGDVISTDELQRAAHAFMRESRQASAMHMRTRDGKIVTVGKVVASVVLTDALQKALGISLGFEPWIVGMEIDDPAVRAAIKNGGLAGLSIAGSGVRQPIDIRE